MKEANEIATSCIQTNPSDADAIYVRALCLIQEDFERGKLVMEKVIKFDPDHEKAKIMLRKMKKLKEKEELGNTFVTWSFRTGLPNDCILLSPTGNKLLQQEKYGDAIKNYSEAIKISPIENAIVQKILYKRAIASSKIGKIGFIRDAIIDCSKLIKNSWIYTKVLKLRAKCHMDMRNFRKCVEDYEALVKIDKSSEVEEMLKQARSALKRSQSDFDLLL